MVFGLGRRLEPRDGANFQCLDDSGVFSYAMSQNGSVSDFDFLPSNPPRRGMKKRATSMTNVLGGSGLLGGAAAGELEGDDSEEDLGFERAAFDPNAARGRRRERRDPTSGKEGDMASPVAKEKTNEEATRRPRRTLLRAPSMDADAEYIGSYGVNSDAHDARSASSEDSDDSELSSPLQFDLAGVTEASKFVAPYGSDKSVGNVSLESDIDCLPDDENDFSPSPTLPEPSVALTSCYDDNDVSDTRPTGFRAARVVSDVIGRDVKGEDAAPTKDGASKPSPKLEKRKKERSKPRERSLPGPIHSAQNPERAETVHSSPSRGKDEITRSSHHRRSSHRSPTSKEKLGGGSGTEKRISSQGSPLSHHRSSSHQCPSNEERLGGRSGTERRRSELGSKRPECIGSSKRGEERRKSVSVPKESAAVVCLSDSANTSPTKGNDAADKPLQISPETTPTDKLSPGRSSMRKTFTKAQSQVCLSPPRPMLSKAESQAVIGSPRVKAGGIYPRMDGSEVIGSPVRFAQIQENIEGNAAASCPRSPAKSLRKFRNAKIHLDIDGDIARQAKVDGSKILVRGGRVKRLPETPDPLPSRVSKTVVETDEYEKSAVDSPSSKSSPTRKTLLKAQSQHCLSPTMGRPPMMKAESVIVRGSPRRESGTECRRESSKKDETWERSERIQACSRGSTSKLVRTSRNKLDSISDRDKATKIEFPATDGGARAAARSTRRRSSIGAGIDAPKTPHKPSQSAVSPAKMRRGSSYGRSNRDTAMVVDVPDGHPDLEVVTGSKSTPHSRGLPRPHHSPTKRRNSVCSGAEIFRRRLPLVSLDPGRPETNPDDDARVGSRRRSSVDSRERKTPETHHEHPSLASGGSTNPVLADDCMISWSRVPIAKSLQGRQNAYSNGDVEPGVAITEGSVGSSIPQQSRTRTLPQSHHSPVKRRNFLGTAINRRRLSLLVDGEAASRDVPSSEVDNSLKSETEILEALPESLVAVNVASSGVEYKVQAVAASAPARARKATVGEIKKNLLRDRQKEVEPTHECEVVDDVNQAASRSQKPRSHLAMQVSKLISRKVTNAPENADLPSEGLAA